MLALILACDENGGIGKDGKLPWPHSKTDMLRFKEMTLNSIIVMGRVTWDGLPIKPLPKRFNIVVSKNYDFDAEGAFVVDNIQKIVSISENSTVFLIGGAKLIESMKDHIDVIYLSRFKGEFECDTFIDLEWIDEDFYVFGDKIYELDHSFEILYRKS